MSFFVNRDRLLRRDSFNLLPGHVTWREFLFCNASSVQGPEMSERIPGLSSAAERSLYLCKPIPRRLISGVSLDGQLQVRECLRRLLQRRKHSAQAEVGLGEIRIDIKRGTEECTRWLELSADAMELANFVTVGLLPGKIRRQYQLGWDPMRAATLKIGAEYARRLLVPVLPGRVRYRPSPVGRQAA